MSLFTEVFGVEAIDWPITKVKEEILKLPPIWSERKSYLLKDWSRINNWILKHKDFTDVGCLPMKK